MEQINLPPNDQEFQSGTHTNRNLYHLEDSLKTHMIQFQMKTQASWRPLVCSKTSHSNLIMSCKPTWPQSFGLCFILIS